MQSIKQPTPPKLIIIADDLTGAFDASAPFCSSQTLVLIATSPEHLPEALKRGADIIAVSSQSREIEPRAAYDKVAQIVSQIPSNTTIFKKVDSRMKGNVAIELNALPERPLLVAPALPSFDRLVKSGKVCGFGVNDPIDIAEALGEHASKSTIIDTHCTLDLDKAVANYPEHLLVGARDLASALARKWGIENSTAEPLSGKIAIAIGSRDPITLGQIEALPASAYHHILAPDGIGSESSSDARIVLLQATSGPQPQSSLTVAKAFAKSFIPLTEHRDGLVLSGGATAEALLNALQLGVVELEGELLPGLPVAKSGNWRIATKSGGFGDVDTLCQLIGHPLHQPK